MLALLASLNESSELLPPQAALLFLECVLMNEESMLKELTIPAFVLLWLNKVGMSK